MMVRQSQGLLSKFSSQTECKSVIDSTNKNFAEKCFFKLSLSIENIILFVIIAVVVRIGLGLFWNTGTKKQW